LEMHLAHHFADLGGDRDRLARARGADRLQGVVERLLADHRGGDRHRPGVTARGRAAIAAAGGQDQGQGGQAGETGKLSGHRLHAGRTEPVSLTGEPGRHPCHQPRRRRPPDGQPSAPRRVTLQAGVTTAPPPREPSMIHDNILETIGRTPVVRLHRLAPAGVQLYAKVEAFNPGGSVKDRLALAIILDAEARGELKPGDTVVEATSGNTGIALAMVCAARGYPFVAVMSDSFSIERRKLMRAYGARVILTPAAERGTGMVRRAEELAREHGWFLARQFENPANPAYHRETTAAEILRDFAGRRLDHFVSGWGTGGTLS